MFIPYLFGIGCQLWISPHLGYVHPRIWESADLPWLLIKIDSNWSNVVLLLVSLSSSRLPWSCSHSDGRNAIEQSLKHMLIWVLLVYHLPTSHWPKQSTWSSLSQRRKTLKSYKAKGLNTRRGKELRASTTSCHFLNLVHPRSFLIILSFLKVFIALYPYFLISPLIQSTALWLPLLIFQLPNKLANGLWIHKSNMNILVLILCDLFYR